MIHVLLSTFPFDNLLLHKLRRNSPGFVALDGAVVVPHWR